MSSKISPISSYVPYGLEDQFSPDLLEFLRGLESITSSMHTFASTTEIKDQGIAQASVDMWADARTIQETLEVARKKALQKYEAEVKKINALAELLEKPLDEIQQIFFRKLSDFVVEFEEVNNLLGTDADKIKGTKGALYQKTTESYEVEDIEKVPDEYFMLDEKKLKKVVGAGVVIPGIKPKKVKSLIMRRI